MSIAPNKTRAYAVLAGGGVKGAALVGGLRAAEKYGIEFVGYGGASAGSVVAFLASLNYATAEMRDIIIDTDFSQFLDDKSGRDIERLRQFGLKRYLLTSWSVFGDGMILNRIRQRLGLYPGKIFDEFLLDKILDKHPHFKDQQSITFKDLVDPKSHPTACEPCKPLKVIASDVSQKKALIYSAAHRDINESVLRAVRASISFPFVFEPITLERPHRRYLVDGGLISNLPVFLFTSEQKKTGYPVVAFDLIPPGTKPTGKYRIRNFCSDLISTALEAGDDLHRQTIGDYISNLFYVPIQVPAGIDTLKFRLTQAERKDLYRRGFLDTLAVLKEKLPELPRAESRIAGVQATLNIPVFHVQSLLRALIQEIQARTPVDNLRAHIMLPVSEEELMVTYHFNMDTDLDQDLVVNTRSKWAREVFVKGEPVFSDLELLAVQPEEWGMKREIIERINPAQKTLLSVPIRDQRKGGFDAAAGESIGVLSIDTATRLQDTLWWSSDQTPFVLEAMRKWAVIVSRVLT